MSFSPSSAWIQRWYPRKWSEIAGNTEIVRHWKNFIQNGTCNGIFTGPNRTGKTRTISLGIGAILCTNRTPTLDPCGHCQSCRLVGEARSDHYGIFSRSTESEYGFHPINCAKVTLKEIEELELGGELYSEKTIVYLDEVAILRKRRLEDRLLKLIDESEATWIASAISVQRKKGKRKGDWTERLSTEMRGRFPIKAGTSLPHPEDLCRWIEERCADWSITIHDPEVTLSKMVDRTDQRVGYVIHMLAYAATKKSRDLTPKEVEEFNLDTTD